MEQKVLLVEIDSNLDLAQANDEIEYLKSELFGHIIVTNYYGFKAERPVFTASLDGQYLC